MSPTIYWLICLVSAHIIADFPLQPNKLVNWKNNLWGKLFHGLIHAAVVYFICGQWHLWYLPLIVGLTHILIDLVPKQDWRFFLLDQILHVIILVVLVLWLPFDEVIVFSEYRVWFLNILVFVSGVTIITMGSGILIGKIMEEHTKRNKLILTGLQNGGMWIG